MSIPYRLFSSLTFRLSAGEVYTNRQRLTLFLEASSARAAAAASLLRVPLPPFSSLPLTLTHSHTHTHQADAGCPAFLPRLRRCPQTPPLSFRGPPPPASPPPLRSPPCSGSPLRPHPLGSPGRLLWAQLLGSRSAARGPGIPAEARQLPQRGARVRGFRGCCRCPAFTTPPSSSSSWSSPRLVPSRPIPRARARSAAASPTPRLLAPAAAAAAASPGLNLGSPPPPAGPGERAPAPPAGPCPGQASPSYLERAARSGRGCAGRERGQRRQARARRPLPMKPRPRLPWGPRLPARAAREGPARPRGRRAAAGGLGLGLSWSRRRQEPSAGGRESRGGRRARPSNDGPRRGGGGRGRDEGWTALLGGRLAADSAAAPPSLGLPIHSAQFRGGL
ncbi:uncharacterized protein [Notamacropus eugenii]|uniref:uncharacterized protein n=1 Tax=Notamacropus eugenii TaxID=9315 RepID=UPI003B672EE1